MNKPMPAKKRGLGRGLEALLGPKGAAAAAAPSAASEDALQPGDSLRQLPVTQLQPGKYQRAGRWTRSSCPSWQSRSRRRA